MGKLEHDDRPPFLSCLRDEHVNSRGPGNSMLFTDRGFQRIFRLADFDGRFFLERLEDFVDCAFELRVGAFGHEGRIVNDLDIRIDSMTFDEPFAFSAVKSHGGHSDRAAINQRRRAGHANEAAPRARADQGAQFRLLEVIGKAIAA